MMWFNRCKKFKNNQLYYYWIVLWYCGVDARAQVHNKCPTGLFKSDFLSGACSPCPKILKSCQNEEAEDAVRCFKACRKIRLTTTRIPKLSPTLSSLLQPSPSPTGSRPISPFSDILPRTYSTSTLSTSGLPTKPTVINGGPSSGSNRDIILGFSFSIGALVLLLIIVVLCWKHTAGKYLAVRTNSMSCSDENVKKNEECDLDGISMSSVQVLNEIRETKL